MKFTVVDYSSYWTPPVPQWNYACGFCRTIWKAVARYEEDVKDIQRRHQETCQAR
jgi:hypothetical protein